MFAENVTDAAVMRPVYRRGNRVMLAMLLAHLVGAIGFAAFYETWFESITVGGLAVAMFGVARALQPHSLLTRCIAGVSLQMFVALHIYQLHGLAEMHFFFFTAFTTMLVYQDWRSLWPGALLIIAQHVLFAILHNQGVEVLFFEDGYIGVTKLGFHFGIALLHVLLCSLWSHLLRRQTLAEARTRAALAAAQDAAERASAQKTEFLGTMSHELRTPLTGVSSMTELLLQRELAPQLREDLEVVRSSAMALVEIINDSLDLARIEAGRLALDHAPMDLRRIAEEVVELLATRADKNGIELVLRWQPGSPEQLLGDAGRWRQILVNLVGNAIKFASGGHVLVEIAAAPAAAGATTEVLARIDDDGPGIPADMLPRLCQRFEQASAATNGRHGGSGLGLAITRELVTRMGGTLTIHSVPGAGATFVVRMPQQVVAPAEPPPHIDARALLVGSRPLTMEVLAEQLEGMGAEVQIAPDPASARELLQGAAQRGRPFDLLFATEAELPAAEARAASLRVVLIDSGGGRGNPDGMVRPTRHADIQRVARGIGRGSAAPRPSLPRLGLHVLLVEDESTCARVAGKMLELLGCTHERAENGFAAIARHRSGHHDAILMDRRMPELDGDEAIRRIRAAEAPGTHVPILGLSANTMPQDREHFLACGADGFLGKPVQLQQLATALQAIAHGARPPKATTSAI